MSSSELLSGIPYWTEKMYRPGGGQDHLGLGSVATDRILPRLSPGINVLTPHPRYWSFYAFVLREFWSRDLPRTKAALRDWYRPLECIYAVACSLCENPEHFGSPVGTRRIAGLISDEPRGFDPQFDYMNSTMGGYGLYYSTVMQAVGLVVLADPRLGLPVDTPTPTGEVVADAFRTVITDTEYYNNWIDRHDMEVPHEVVAEYGELACFCRLRDESALDRPVLVDAFLHHGNPAEAEGRRQTLRMFCELATQTKTVAVDAASFRRLIYYGADHAAEVDESGAAFVPPEPLVRTARKWRLYQAREYFNASLNEMWRRLSDWGLDREGDIYPVPKADILESIDAIDFNGFAESVGVDLPANGFTAESPYQELLEWVMSVGGVTGQLDDRWELDRDLTEDRIIEWLGYGQSTTDNGPDVLAATLTLVTFVAARLWPSELPLLEPDDWFPVVEGGRDRLGMQRFINTLRERVDAGETIGEIARWLTLDYVIAQHERVATAKLSTTGDTFRFRQEAGRLRFFSKDAKVGMNDSRFNALATFVYELGWCGYLYVEDHGLTKEGELLRADGDLPISGAFNSLAIVEGS
jgi:hypothetical protein